MKKISTIILSLLLLSGVSVIIVQGQTKKAKDARGLLYKITGKNLKKPSYLFGTIHIVCPNDMFSKEKLTAAIDETEQLILELDMDDPGEMKAMQTGAVFTNGKTIKDFLSPEQYAKVDELTKSVVGVPIENLKTLKPFMLQTFLTTSPKSIGCSPPSSYELTFVQVAAEKKKPIIGLETAQSQYDALDKTPMEEQAKKLYEMALDPNKSFADFKKLVEAYKMQDSDALYNEMNAQMSKDKMFQSRLLDERNIVWIPKLEKEMREKSSFIAVGGGHLGGKKGVINLLKDKGYKITAVKL